MKKNRSLGMSLGWGGLGLWLLVICWPYFSKMPVPDESTFLYEGYRLANGEIPYRDFFDFILPGIFFLVATLIKLFGVSLVAFRVVALLMLLASIAITFYISRFFLSGGWRITFALFLLLMHIPDGMELQHHLCSVFTGLVAVFCLWRALLLDRPMRPHWLSVAGFCIGLTVLFTQTLGVALGAVLTIYLVLYFWKQAGWPLATSLFSMMLRFGLPALTPIALTFGWFAAIGALVDLWQSTFVWLIHGGYANTTSHWYFLDGWTKLNSFSKLLFRDYRLTLFLMFMVLSGALPIVGLLWPVAYFWRKRFKDGQAFWKRMNRNDWRLLLVWMAGSGFFLAIFSYPNTRMIVLHGWLLYALAWVGLSSLYKHRQRLHFFFRHGL